MTLPSVRWLMEFRDTKVIMQDTGVCIGDKWYMDVGGSNRAAGIVQRLICPEALVLTFVPFVLDGVTLWKREVTQAGNPEEVFLKGLQAIRDALCAGWCHILSGGKTRAAGISDWLMSSKAFVRPFLPSVLSSLY